MINIDISKFIKIKDVGLADRIPYTDPFRWPSIYYHRIIVF